jgi:hypothetical protein
VSAKYCYAVIRNFINFFYKNHTLLTQGINNALIVNNFVTHIDWGTVDFERLFNNLDSALNTSAKAAWLR